MAGLLACRRKPCCFKPLDTAPCYLPEAPGGALELHVSFKLAFLCSWLKGGHGRLTVSKESAGMGLNWMKMSPCPGGHTEHAFYITEITDSLSRSPS